MWTKVLLVAGAILEVGSTTITEVGIAVLDPTIIVYGTLSGVFALVAVVSGFKLAQVS